jgi:hypothetical protein
MNDSITRLKLCAKAQNLCAMSAIDVRPTDMGIALVGLI